MFNTGVNYCSGYEIDSHCEIFLIRLKLACFWHANSIDTLTGERNMNLVSKNLGLGLIAAILFLTGLVHATGLNPQSIEGNRVSLALAIDRMQFLEKAGKERNMVLSLQTRTLVIMAAITPFETSVIERSASGEAGTQGIDAERIKTSFYLATSGLAPVWEVDLLSLQKKVRPDTSKMTLEQMNAEYNYSALSAARYLFAISGN